MIDWQFLDHRPWLRLHQSGSSNSWGTSLKWSSVYWRKWLHFLLSVAFMCSSVPFSSDRFADSLGGFFFYFIRARARQRKTLMYSRYLQFHVSPNTGFLSSSSGLVLPVLNVESAAHRSDNPPSQPRSLAPNKGIARKPRGNAAKEIVPQTRVIISQPFISAERCDGQDLPICATEKEFG